MKENDILAALPIAPDAKDASGIPTPIINTPSTSTSPHSGPGSRRPSPSKPNGSLAGKIRHSPPPRSAKSPAAKSQVPRWIPQDERPSDLDLEEEGEEMEDSRVPLHRPTDGRSHMPLLKDEEGRASYDGPTNGNARSTFATRRATFQSRSPDMEGSSTVKKKYTYAAFFLILSLISFVIQTETAVYIQHELGWNKAYAML